MMQNVLRHAPPGQGLVLDQVLESVEALKPVTQAVEDKAPTTSP